jgi:integrase
VGLGDERLQRDAEAGVELADHEKSGKTRRYIVFHDRRHTFASHWVMRGGDIFRLQKILGHQSVQMTMRYAHLAPDVFKDDYDRLGTCAPTMGEVVPLALARPAD